MTIRPMMTNKDKPKLTDYDLPRIGHTIDVGEDIIHAFIEVESLGYGYRRDGIIVNLYEPHVAYRNLRGSQRQRAVEAGVAYKSWRRGYPKDSMPRIETMARINRSVAIMATSLGLGQVLGENFSMLGFKTPEDMLKFAVESEANQLELMIRFVKARKIDDELRKLDKHKGIITPEMCVPVVRVYNGRGYAKNRYHIRFANALNKWRAIPDTPWHPGLAEQEEYQKDTAKFKGNSLIRLILNFLQKLSKGNKK